MTMYMCRWCFRATWRSWGSWWSWSFLVKRRFWGTWLVLELHGHRAVVSLLNFYDLEKHQILVMKRPTSVYCLFEYRKKKSRMDEKETVCSQWVLVFSFSPRRSFLRGLCVFCLLQIILNPSCKRAGRKEHFSLRHQDGLHPNLGRLWCPVCSPHWF